MTTNSSQCEECDVKMVICCMASCGNVAWVGMDKHGNKNNVCMYIADNPSENIGLLPVMKFMDLRMLGS